MDTLLDTPAAERRLRDFATAMAKQIEPFPAICKSLGLTEKEAALLQEHPVYQAFYESELAEWTSAKNAAMRAEIKSARTVEELIPTGYALVLDPEAPANSRVEMFKALAKLGRVGERTATTSGGAVGETVKIVINLGQDQKVQIEKPMPVIEAVSEAIYE